jgi:16S rRNA (guanine1207-N2)-methyltransferase
VADLGGGWGYLSQFILEHRPLVREVHLYEADAIALDLARRNLSPFIRQEEGAPVVTCDWADVTEGLGSATFDTVVMNPPFHQGRQADPMLGHKFMAAAMAALRPGGQLWMVANQFLPYERFLTEALPNTHVVWQSGGYKILHGARPQAPEKPPRGWGATPHRKKGRRDTERIRP